jgi:mono/diheme cytochrome c family protein
MPGWKGILSDEEAWNIVRYIRHLPPKGSLGTATVFQEAEEEHEHGRDIDEEHRPQNQQHPHTH